MANIEFVDKIRDPIHGFIYVSEIEKNIIDSTPFQRLRNIKQLAFTNYLYPGAEHTRFSHSLGVMEFSSKIYDILVQKSKERLKEHFKWNHADFEKYKQLVRIVALIHDLGHAPFSHGSEDCFEKGLKHEDYTRFIIETDHIKKVIDHWESKTSVLHAEVVDFFKRTVNPIVAFLKPIFSGEVDADRIDYLLRDSHFTGVHYGRFDHDRLINSLCLIEEPNEGGNLVIAIEEGGIHALEALIIARYFMFTQVYFHRVRRSYDLHLSRFLKKVIKKYPANVDEFIQYNDKKVIDLMENNQDNIDAASVLYRRYFKEAFHTIEHCKSVDRIKFKWLQKEAINEFGEEGLMFDEAKKAPHKFREIDFYVKTDKQKIKRVKDVSRLMDALEIIEQYRIYSNREIRDEVDKFCDDFWNKNM